MKRIVIKRIELTTYCNTVELPDDEADKLIEFPELHERRLHELCRATTENWMDADAAEYEVEEDDES